jgi:predicted 2-oxoglutarate/Fe(II)-dependent dioxygenase YbiX
LPDSERRTGPRIWRNYRYISTSKRFSLTFIGRPCCGALNPIFFYAFQRDCAEISSIQLANYNVKDKKQGAWHHDESSDMSVVVPLNTGEYEGGGTEFHGLGKLSPLPTGHALIFPSFTKMHRGLPVVKGDRFLLVFWLHNRGRLAEMKEMAEVKS